MSHLYFRPPLGFGIALLAVVVAAAAAVWSYGRASGAQRDMGWNLLRPMRLAVLIVLAWMLAGPSDQVSQDSIIHKNSAGPLLLLVDTSASMNEQDVSVPRLADPAQPQRISRWQAVVQTWLSPTSLSNLRDEGWNVQLFGFDEQLRVLDPNEVGSLTAMSGQRTNLFEALDQSLDSYGERGSRTNESHAASGLIVLLSDGHDSSQLADWRVLEKLKQSGWPVVAVSVGTTRNTSDIALHAWADVDRLLENQSTWIDTVVTQTGFGDREAQVELRHEQKLIASKQIRFGGRSSVQVRFQVTPELLHGQPVAVHGYKLTAQVVSNHLEGESNDPDDGESFTDNNSRWVFVKVSGDRIKVALFEGQPHWDTKYLAAILRQDPQVELTAVYRIGSDRSIVIANNELQNPAQKDLGVGEGVAENFFSQGLTTPDQATLNHYDVVVLGKGVEPFFGGQQAKLLVDYVTQRGGALVLARGQPFGDESEQGLLAQEILSAISPVQWGSQTVGQLRLRVTKAGQTNPLTQFDSLGDTDTVLTHLPDIIAATRIKAEKAASVVLIRQQSLHSQSRPSENSPDGPQNMAAVAYQHVGFGRVFAVLGEGFWRWSFLPSRLEAYDSVYALFWTRVIRWLKGDEPFLPVRSVSLFQSKFSSHPGEPVTVTAITRYVQDDSVQPHLIVTAPSGHRQRLGMSPLSEERSQYTAAVTPTESGVYHLRLEWTRQDTTVISDLPIRTSRLAVYDPSLERLDTSARPDVLATISQATGGRSIELDQREQLVAFGRELQSARRSTAQIRYVFDQPWLLVLMVSLLGLEWFVRRRRGLL